MTMPIRPRPIFLERSLTLPGPKPCTDTRSRLVSLLGFGVINRDANVLGVALGSGVLGPTIWSKVVGRSSWAPFEGVVGLADGDELFEYEDVGRSCAGIDILT